MNNANSFSMIDLPSCSAWLS